MTKPKDNKTHGKVGLAGILGDYPPATVETLAGDDLLIKLYSILEPETLLDINTKVTPIQGDYAGEKLDTENSIGLVLRNKDYEPVSLICITPSSNSNSNIKPIITDTNPSCAFIIGRLDSDYELVAVNNLHDGIELASYFITDKVTVIVSPNDWLFTDTVKHFAQDNKVTVFTTLGEKNKLSKQLAGINVKLVIPTLGILSHVENSVSYAAVLSYDDTQVIDLQSSDWADPETLSTDPSKPTPYPIDAFTGLLKNVVKAIAYYSKVPDAMAGQSVLGALAHMGQRFIDAPIFHNHQPASLMIIIEGESGSGKSTCMGLTHFKIREYERQQYEIYIKEITKWDKEKSATPIKNMPAFLEANPKPKNPVTVFKDATIEPILDKFVDGSTINASWTTDEAGQFFSGYSMKGDTAGNALSALTTIHSDGEVSRLRSQKNAYAMAKTNAYGVRLTLVLMGQRVVLEEALTDPLMNEQGFLARALISCPEDLRGKRTLDDIEHRKDKPHDNPYLIEYWARCENLLTPFLGNIPRELNGKESPRVKMQWADNGAEKAFYKGMQLIENKQAKGKPFEFLKAYASRMAENASRIASLMAYFDNREAITTDDITRAFMLVEYSTAERLRYLDATPQGAQNDSEKLSSWLVNRTKNKTPAIVNRTDVYNGAPKPMRKSNKLLQNELDNLESVGHIRQMEDGKKKVIYINPKLYQ